MHSTTVSTSRGGRPTRRRNERGKVVRPVTRRRREQGYCDWLVEGSPAFAALSDEARAVDRDACASLAWAKLKPKLTSVVGWDAESPFLRSEETYERATRLLVAELPECVCCGGAR